MGHFSSSRRAAAGGGEAERHQLDGGVGQAEHPFKGPAVLPGVLLQHAGAGELSC